MKRSIALLCLSIDTSTIFQKKLDSLQVSGVRSKVQGRLLVIVASVNVASMFEQVASNIDGACEVVSSEEKEATLCTSLHANVERGAASHSAGRVHVNSDLQKGFRDWEAA